MDTFGQVSTDWRVHDDKCSGLLTAVYILTLCLDAFSDCQHEVYAWIQDM